MIGVVPAIAPVPCPVICRFTGFTVLQPGVALTPGFEHWMFGSPGYAALATVS